MGSQSLLRMRGRGPRSHLSATTWLVPFLAATLALSVWLGYEAQAAVRSHRDAAEAALRDYAHMAAWQYSRLAQENLGDLLESVFDEVPRRLPRRDLPGPYNVRREMDDALDDADCDCDALLSALVYFRLTLAGARSVTTDDNVAPTVDAWLSNSLIAIQQSGALEREGLLTVAAGEMLDERAVIGYSVTYDGAAPHSIYGFIAPAAAFAALFEVWYHSGELLPPAIAGGLPNDSLIHVAVRDRGGATLFESGAEYPRGLSAVDSVGARYASLEVEAAVRPDAASRLIIGGLPRSKLPLILALLLMTVGVGAAGLLQVRRERQLARMRDDFISGVSHELRTPLAQIRMFAELEEAGKLRTPQERQRATRAIHRESKRLTHLVENILRFSRLRRLPRQDVLLREEIVIGPAVDELIEGYQPLAAARNVTIRSAIQHDVSTIASRDALNQILVNLLDNALKYGPAGQTVTVAATRQGGRVLLAVEDQGPGIPAEERRRIWTPYHRLERDIVARRTGTGIGLAVVAELAALHEGRAWVEDAPGRGSRFIVELPAAARAGDSAGQEPVRAEVHA